MHGVLLRGGGLAPDSVSKIIEDITALYAKLVGIPREARAECADSRAVLIWRAVDDIVITELRQLGEWVRKMEYNRDDAPDEIARAIENRIREIERNR